MTRRKSWGHLALSCGALLALACSRPAAPPPSSDVQWDTCFDTTLPSAARCTAIRVPVAPGRADGIQLRVAKLPAISEPALPDALFIAVGGPGQSAIQTGTSIAQALSGVRRDRDIVLMDQRGTGSSHPLTCEESEQPLADLFAPRPELDQVKACRSRLSLPPSVFTTSHTVDDIEHVRQKLGYTQLNLWGGSYGTRVAMQYAARYPQHVRTMVLDGAAPVDIALPLHFPWGAQEALERLASACNAQVGCQAKFGNVANKVDELLRWAAAAPRTVQLSHPRRGTPLQLDVTRDGLASALLGLLYSSDLASLLPLAVEQALAGNFAPLVTAASTFADQLDLSEGLFLSIVCAEDVPQITDARAAEAATQGFLGGTSVATLREQCRVWGETPSTTQRLAPAASGARALVLSGALDPATPPRFGELVTSRLPHARHVVVEQASHGVTTLGCVPELIEEFIQAGTAAELDVRCVNEITRPPFFLTPSGPQP